MKFSFKRLSTWPDQKQLRKLPGYITPETTVDDPVNLDDLNGNKYIRMIRELDRQIPGGNCCDRNGQLQNISQISLSHQRKVPEKQILQDLTMIILILHSKLIQEDLIEVYHKSKLVPGIEMQFANGPGRLISRILPYLGGTKWGYGMQEERTCFTHHSPEAEDRSYNML